MGREGGGLDSLQDERYEIVDGILIGSVHFLRIAVSYYHAAGHGTVSEDGGKTGKSRRLHLKVAYLQFPWRAVFTCVIPEGLDLGILLGVLNLHPDSSALRAIETSASDGDATNHVIGRNLIQESIIGGCHIGSAFLWRPVHVLTEGFLQFKVANPVAIGIIIEQTIEPDTLLACYEGTQRSFGLETTTGADANEGELTERGIVLARLEVDVCQSIQFVYHDVDVVASDTGGKHGDALAMVCSGDGTEFA